MKVLIDILSNADREICTLVHLFSAGLLASCKRYFSENFVKRKIAEFRKLDTFLEHLMLQDMLKFTHTPTGMPQVTGIHMEDEIE